ncbi:MAG: ComEA family DNA-binding protein [Bacteroidia bacterium]
MLFKFLFLFLTFSLHVSAQEDLLIKDLLDGIIEDLPEDLDLLEVSERLLYLRKHPININSANKEELQQLFFLSSLQIGNFLSYRSLNGKFIDVLELQAIPSFDIKTVQKLLPLVTLGDDKPREKVTFKSLKRLGENDLLLRYGRILEKVEGFKNLAGNKYVGTPEKLTIRYKFNFANRISMSAVSEKDAGEKLDPFLSANLTINDVKFIQRFIIGDYSLQFGQGLTLWSGFGFGKGADVTSIAKKADGLKPYSSANEYAFFRGIGSKIALSDRIELTCFFSSRKHDASVRNDDEGGEVITTLNETGYHRTPNEIKSKNTVIQGIYGAALAYQMKSFNMGIISYKSDYSKKFIADKQPYQVFNFTGNRLVNFGFHYNQTFNNFYLFGEIAKSSTGGIAGLNGFLVSLSNKVSGVFLYRNYGKNYHNFFNQAASEANGFNEKGLYMGFNISITRNWALSCYADYFKFPWLKFRIDAPSTGYEALSQLTYTPTKTFKANLRFKTESKQQNTDQDVPLNFLEIVKRQSLRADVNWKLSKTLSLQNRLELSNYRKGKTKLEIGYLIYQDLAIAPSGSKFSGNARLGYFSTSSYNTRLYAYEDDLLYNFSFGMYHGKGIRNYINIKYKMLKKTDIWMRYAIFHYQNTNIVGSGLDQILGNKKSELKFQLRHQF